MAIFKEPSAELRLRVLDRLVVQHASRGQQTAGCQADDTRIYQAVMSGHIDEALKIATELGLLKDSRLLFLLRKQEAAEHLRRGEDAAALGCLRQHLAPLALSAYPEAYTEMKDWLPKLLDAVPKCSRTQELAQDMAVSYLAGLLRRTVRQMKGLEKSDFMLMVTYLLLIQRTARGASADRSLIPDGECDDLQLLGHEHDTAPLPAPGQTRVPDKVSEHDVQSLKEAAGLTRAEAVQSLCHTKGDLHAALRNELSSHHLSTAILDPMLREYMAYRSLEAASNACPAQGLEQSHQRSPAAADEADGRPCKRQCSLHEPISDSACSSPAASVSEGAANEQAQEQAIVDSVKALRVDGKLSPSFAGMRSRISQSPACSPPRKLAKSNVRSEHHCHVVPRLQNGTATPEAQQQDFSHLLSLLNTLKQQQFAQVEAAIEQLNPCIFSAQPHLRFQLRRQQFHMLVRQGGLAAAIRFARAKLTPLAEAHPKLLPLLKEAMAFLVEAPQHDGAQEDEGLLELHDELQSALLKPLGLHPPRLLTLLQGLLATHASWFRTQRCKDPFADLLHVDAIKVSAASPAHAGPKISCTTAGGGGPGGKASAGKIHGSHSVLAPPARRSSSRFQQGRDSPNTWLEQARRNQMEYLQHRQEEEQEGIDEPSAVAAPDDPPHTLADAAAARTADASASSSSDEDAPSWMEEDEDGDEDSEASQVQEDAIVQVMEFAALHRGEAIDLLQQHGGDVQSVLESVLG